MKKKMEKKWDAQILKQYSFSLERLNIYFSINKKKKIIKKEKII